MELKTLSLYVAVIVVSGALAWAVFGSKSEAPVAEPTNDSTDSIADPLWYRHLSAEESIEALKYRLPLLSSSAIAPEQTGPMKDEVALLCDFHEVCIDAFVDHVKSRNRPGAGELSSFMEVCARVKNPKLVPLIEAGLKHPAWEVVFNAAEAATTQGDQRAVSFLMTALMENQGVEVYRIIEALVQTGGDEAFAALTYGLQRTDPLVLKALLVPLAEAGYRPAIEEVRALTSNQDIEVCVIAAFALSRMGQTEGRLRLKEIAADESLPGPARAQALSYLTEAWAPGSDFVEFMRVRLGDSDPAVAFEARLALAKVGDEEIHAQLKLDLKDEFGGTRRAAIGLLASTGRDVDANLLSGYVAEMSPDELALLMRATMRGGATDCIGLVAKVAERSDSTGYAAIQGLVAMGDPALPFLKELVGHHDERTMKLAALGAIASIVSFEARTTLESLNFRDSREYWLAQRNFIKHLDLKLAKF